MSAATAGSLPPALYIPSSAQLPSLYSTDEYVEPTPYVYHCHTDRLLTVGNPYFEVKDADKPGPAVPKVNANQYRVFRLKLPDPNGTFTLPEGTVNDPERYRLVWQVVGLEVNRGQPLGIGLCGAPLFNRGRDVENPNNRTLPEGGEQDNRANVAIDPKQNQMLIVGCSPAVGQHWTAAKPCDDDTLDTRCPPIELVNTVIEDGDMSDIGFGPMDFGSLGANRSDVPLELVKGTSKYPDWIKMRTDPYGDTCFYFVRREQLYARRLWQHSGNPGEPIPTGLYSSEAYASSNNTSYFAVPSGSVITSDTQIFNRPYWLSQAQGHNNGVCWGEDLFVTVLDNTRNIILNITALKDGVGGDHETNYKRLNYDAFVRHVEEYEITALVRLCRVPLTTDVLAHLYRMSPRILDRWGISEAPQPNSKTEDRYRYLGSQATRCPLPKPPEPPSTVDPWANYKFWEVDCTNRLTPELPMYPLGRKYLALPRARASTTVKRPAPTSTAATRTTRAKRRRL
ncbi:L1 [Duck papillomavirus 3]|uniref:Major capsid protein L1 n=1 Tax=Duck papillomavirus 3 TaxID=2562546 RepID=A0AAE6D3E3_9PAPI|nr:L1 [Duck papillomavirus 3]QBR99489.1 L1 [Duck papillomavirus 3]QBR99490.1 L1 [Duck papillomavirus 3]QBR99492.1 L1 [Duck papillomavirus 3]QBR99494.1 L1 [Duck papillomavirus 3]